MDARVRNGSSTFSSIADPKEVEKGCAVLKEDIESGRIACVIDSYKDRNKGDYIFVIGRSKIIAYKTSGCPFMRKFCLKQLLKVPSIEPELKGKNNYYNLTECPQRQV